MRNIQIRTKKAVAHPAQRLFTMAVVMAVVVAGFALQASAAGVQIHLDHWANGGSVQSATKWVDGNLHWTNSTYHEGDADPTRFIMDSLPAGQHTLTFTWLTTKKQGPGQGKHAHDFLTTYNFSGVIVAGVDPCLPRVQGGGNGPSVCTLGSAPTSTFAIPADAQVGGIQLPGVFSMWNGTITGVSSYTYSPSTQPFQGTSSDKISVTFTTTGGDVVLALGGHLALDTAWPGNNNGAQDINGAPYHWSYVLVDKDGAAEAQGNRDRSIMIMQKGAIVGHKHCIGLPNGRPFHEDDLSAQGFPFAVTQPSNLIDGLPPNGFPLDCDEDQGAIIDAVNGAFSITEVPPQSPEPEFDLSDISCRLILNGKDVGEATGFGKNLATGTANFNFIAGDNVHCHFTNKKRGRIIVEKKTYPAGDGQAFSFTTGGGPSPFNGAINLSDGQTKKSGALKPGTYTVGEDSAGGWVLSNIACSYDVVGSGTSTFPTSGTTQPASITLGAGDSVHCTFTNTKKGTLQLVKDLEPNSDAGRFNLLVNGTTCSPAGGVGDYSCDAITVNAGNNTIGETAVAGTFLSDYTRTVSCTDGTNNVPVDANGTVNVPPGANVVCTIRNVFNTQLRLATLKVVKCVINDNGGTSIASTFTIHGPEGDFQGVGPTYTTAQTCDTTTGTQLLLSEGTYSVTELVDTDYAPTYSNCTDVFIPRHTTQTCLITNNDNPVVGSRHRMTGGGSVFTTGGTEIRVTQGFELHCSTTAVPNNLEINWGASTKFKLSAITSVRCDYDGGLASYPPNAGFNRLTAEGTGTYNDGTKKGQSATIKWVFVDHGEPGVNDTSTIEVKVGTTVVLSVSGPMNRGNIQAHK